MFYLLKKYIKKYCFLHAKGTFHGEISTQDLSTEFCITVHAPNTSFSCIIKGRIDSIEYPYRVLLLNFETITFISL